MRTSFFPKLKRSWNALLNLGFGLLCIRFLFVTSQESDWTAVLLSAVGFALGWWRPATSLFVFILSLSLISGLELTVLFAPYSAVLTIASSLWLGLSARKLFPVPLAESTEIKPADAPGRTAGRMALIIDVLVTIALVSVYIQTWRDSVAPDFWRRIWPPASVGLGGNTSYFLPGFLWLHGLFYFRAIREHPSADIISPAGIKLTLLVNGIVLLFFLGVQWKFDLPARWVPGFQSPYEDIATFGIMAGCFLLCGLALLRRGSLPWSLLLGPGAVLLVVAVIASWSRGTWLASSTFLVVLALLRLPRFIAILIPAALLSAMIFLNLNVGQHPSVDRSYLDKLVSLVRFESPRAKNLERFDLYYKALAMIHERPWTGHGVGSFYGSSPSYASQSDPKPNLPQFAHNILLQLAAEQGVPVAILFSGLVGWAFWRGIRCWNSYRQREAGGSMETETARVLAHLALALTLALGAYIQANMTWEILLVHPTQPYFFWFLMAALWATTDRANGQIRAPGKQPLILKPPGT